MCVCVCVCVCVCHRQASDQRGLSSFYFFIFFLSLFLLKHLIVPKYIMNQLEVTKKHTTKYCSLLFEIGTLNNMGKYCHFIY